MAHMSASVPSSPPSPPLSPADEKTWSVLVHLGGIFVAWVAPLVGYLLLKDRGAFVRHHMVAALNFQLTLAIAYVIGVATSFIGIGLLIMLAAWVLSIVFGILAAKAASEGRTYDYPFAIDFIR